MEFFGQNTIPKVAIVSFDSVLSFYNEKNTNKEWMRETEFLCYV